MDFVTAGLAGAVPIAAAGLGWLAARQRNMDRWLLPYLAQRLTRPAPQPGKRVCLLLCVADHFEPRHEARSPAQARDRVERWMTEYPRLFGEFRDADGRPPRHSFFYPLEQYDRWEMDHLAELCGQGYGEVEVHLHHENDTADNLRKTLAEYTAMLADRHGLLARDRRTGAVKYGFIHGDWALANSRPDGRCCGVQGELAVLKETGCYADFTFPSAPERNQPRTINRIYYAPTDAGHHCPLATVAAPAGGMMLIPGPLALDWRRRKWGVMPRIENACLQGSQPPDADRVRLWLSARVQVPTRPDWFFVKLHTHGAPEWNQAAVLGRADAAIAPGVGPASASDPTFHVPLRHGPGDVQPGPGRRGWVDWKRERGTGLRADGGRVLRRDQSGGSLMTEVVATESVLEREQAFFDHEAAALTDRELVIDPSQTRRYREARLRAGNIPKDTLFARLQPLAGKRVLDYGCGTGESTCHLANCGAEVTAFDLSPESVAVARRRADLNGLGGRIRFDVYRAGETGYTAGSFDAIIGFAILHHLHEMLPTIYKEIRTLLAPGGTAYFIEPVANSRFLRGLRSLAPVPSNATPDERQLQYADLELIKNHGFSRVRYDHFHCLTRLTRVTGGRGEGVLRRLDHRMLRVAPFLKRWYGIVLMSATA